MDAGSAESDSGHEGLDALVHAALDAQVNDESPEARAERLQLFEEYWRKIAERICSENAPCCGARDAGMDLERCLENQTSAQKLLATPIFELGFKIRESEIPTCLDEIGELARMCAPFFLPCSCKKVYDPADAPVTAPTEPCAGPPLSLDLSDECR